MWSLLFNIIFNLYLILNFYFCIIVVTMFIDASTYKRGDRTYRRVLLRNSYRENGQVRHDTIANLSECSEEEIQALKLALKHKNDLSQLSALNPKENIQTQQGLGVGAVWALHQLAKRFGLSQALGHTRSGKLALWLILACIIEQGSRLSAVRLAQRHHVCEILGLDGFNEEDLYDAMDELSKNQAMIEDCLFSQRYTEEKPHFYLYDVTSSYFEGEQNELAHYGYNRDKKSGKKQIVVGLMTDEEGRPITVEVFEGNTQDPKTVKNQIEKLAERFGVKDITLVGDRGMIKKTQIADLQEKDFHYITAITKPQIESLINQEVIQLSLFDENIVEVSEDNIRYVLHRNPVRAEEIELTRRQKLSSLESFVDKKNRYLVEHPKSSIEIAQRGIMEKAKRLRIDKWLKIEFDKRKASIVVDEEIKKEISRLDGCYTIKTDLSKEIASADQIHARYKDLAHVERAFRTMKTVLLEMRAIYVRKAERTRAHVFVIMLAYLLTHFLRESWRDVELTVEEGIAELASIHSLEVHMLGHAVFQTIPKPRPMAQLLLEKIEVSLPNAIPPCHAAVVTRKKLVSERK